MRGRAELEFGVGTGWSCCAASLAIALRTAASSSTERAIVHLVPGYFPSKWERVRVESIAGMVVAWSRLRDRGGGEVSGTLGGVFLGWQRLAWWSTWA